MSLAIPEVRDITLPARSRKALAGLICGLLSFCFGPFASIPALIFGDRALRDIDRNPTPVPGRTAALIGIITAALGLYVMPILLLLVVLPFVRDRIHRAQDADNLQRIGKAWIANADEHEGLMLPFCRNANWRPLLSWRVAILPDLGERELYEQFHLDEPWNSPHNLVLVGRMPKVYAHPADPYGAAKGLTHYRIFVGPPSVFGDMGQGPISYPATFSNGTSQTILVGESADGVPWTKPDEMRYDPDRPIPEQFGGLLHGGFNVVMADGTTRFFRDDVSEKTLRKAIGEWDGGMDW